MRLTKEKLYKLCQSVKSCIADDYQAFDGDDRPGIQLTVACNDDLSGWSFQTGDNSYTGGAYSFPHWAVVGVYRDSNCRELASEILNQLIELLPANR